MSWLIILLTTSVSVVPIRVGDYYPEDDAVTTLPTTDWGEVDGIQLSFRSAAIELVWVNGSPRLVRVDSVVHGRR